MDLDFLIGFESFFSDAIGMSYHGSKPKRNGEGKERACLRMAKTVLFFEL